MINVKNEESSNHKKSYRLFLFYHKFRRILINSKYDYYWKIAYRRRSDFESSILTDIKTPFCLISNGNNDRYWSADPFIKEYKGNIYLFFELFDRKKKKGSIAYSELRDNHFTEAKIVIDEKFHLSFPFIFENGNNIYMIPESGSIKKILLYECIEFPEKWVRTKIILSEVNSTDTILFCFKDNYYLLASFLLYSNCYDVCNCLYNICPNNFEILKKIVYHAQGTYGVRNGGGIFKQGNKFFRPGQDCEMAYGKALVIWEIDFRNNRYEERKCMHVGINDIILENGSDDENYCGIHTYNLSENYEVIDVKISERNSLIIRFIVLYRIIKEKFKSYFFQRKHGETITGLRI